MFNFNKKILPPNFISSNSDGLIPSPPTLLQLRVRRLKNRTPPPASDKNKPMTTNHLPLDNKTNSSDTCAKGLNNKLPRSSVFTKRPSLPPSIPSPPKKEARTVEAVLLPCQATPPVSDKTDARATARLAKGELGSCSLNNRYATPCTKSLAVNKLMHHVAISWDLHSAVDHQTADDVDLNNQVASDEGDVDAEEAPTNDTTRTAVARAAFPGEYHQDGCESDDSFQSLGQYHPTSKDANDGGDKKMPAATHGDDDEKKISASPSTDEEVAEEEADVHVDLDEHTPGVPIEDLGQEADATSPRRDRRKSVRDSIDIFNGRNLEKIEQPDELNVIQDLLNVEGAPIVHQPDIPDILSEDLPPVPEHYENCPPLSILAEISPSNHSLSQPEEGNFENKHHLSRQAATDGDGDDDAEKIPATSTDQDPHEEVAEGETVVEDASSASEIGARTSAEAEAAAKYPLGQQIVMPEGGGDYVGFVRDISIDENGAITYSVDYPRDKNPHDPEDHHQDIAEADLDVLVTNLPIPARRGPDLFSKGQKIMVKSGNLQTEWHATIVSFVGDARVAIRYDGYSADEVVHPHIARVQPIEENTRSRRRRKNVVRK